MTCLKRAQLEAERRFCGSSTEEKRAKNDVEHVSGDPPKWLDREIVPAFLDPRMVNYIETTPADVVTNFLSRFQDQYVKFGLNAELRKRNQRDQDCQEDEDTAQAPKKSKPRLVTKSSLHVLQRLDDVTSDERKKKTKERQIRNGKIVGATI